MKLRRLTPQERKRLGVSKGSKRRVDASLKRITKATKLYTDRQVATIRLKERIGRAITKEQFTKAVKRGEAQYKSPQTALATAHAADARYIRSYIPEITPRDLKLVIKWFELSGRQRGRTYGKGDHGDVKQFLSEQEQEEFDRLYRRYTWDSVRQAFGSNSRDTGSYNIAA